MNFRPNWLPTAWRYWGPMAGHPWICRFCGDVAGRAATTWEEGVAWCDRASCEQAAKTAICGEPRADD